jgi:hypothetical protein
MLVLQGGRDMMNAFWGLFSLGGEADLTGLFVLIVIGFALTAPRVYEAVRAWLRSARP